MRRTAFNVHVGLTGLLLGPLLAGCLPFVPVYYAYPTVAHTPAVAVDADPQDVRAFRVDVADHDTCIEFPEEDRYVLTPVPLSPAGSVPAQTRVALDHGWVWNCLALIFDGHTHHTVMVRLYRPGWRTVEVASWERKGRVAWEVAADGEAREKAVDAILSTWATDSRGRLFDRPEGPEGGPGARPLNTALFRSLAAGSASPAHRQVLLFVAAEYERLATRPDEAAAQRARLAEKAR